MVVNRSSNFLTVVEKHFSFLLNDFNFSIAEPYNDLAELKSRNCIVVVVAGNNQCTVSIRPTGDAAKQLKSKKLFTNSIDIEIIMNKLHTEEEFEPSHSVLTIEDIDDEVKRNAELMKKYCTKMLNGDFSEWELLYK